MVVLKRKLTISFIIMAMILGIMAVSTDTSSAASTKTLVDGTNYIKTIEECNNTNYFKFTAKHTGLVWMYMSDMEYEKYINSYCNSVLLYTKVDGKYKYIGPVRMNPMVTKGKTYYIKVKLKDSASKKTDEQVRLSVETGYTLPDGGSKTSTAKKMLFNTFDTMGYMTYYDGANDWYKFSLNSKKKVKVQVHLYTVARDGKFSVTIYKGTKKIKTQTFAAKSDSNKTITYTLKKGTYRVKVRRLNKSLNTIYDIGVIDPVKSWEQIKDNEDDDIE